MCDNLYSLSETVTMHIDLVLIFKFTAIILHMRISHWRESVVDLTPPIYTVQFSAVRRRAR